MTMTMMSMKTKMMTGRDQIIMFLNGYIVEEDSHRREDKGRRCWFGDGIVSIECIEWIEQKILGEIDE